MGYTLYEGGRGVLVTRLVMLSQAMKEHQVAQAATKRENGCVYMYINKYNIKNIHPLPTHVREHTPLRAWVEYLSFLSCMVCSHSPCTHAVCHHTTERRRHEAVMASRVATEAVVNALNSGYV